MNPCILRTEEDRKLYAMMPHFPLLDEKFDWEKFDFLPEMRHTVVEHPGPYRFLHECAIIKYHGVLFAAWYNCPVSELSGTTPIRMRRSFDDGLTWSEVSTVAGDGENERFLYCPPVFGIEDDTLYLFLNRMTGADLIHSLDLLRWDAEQEKFVFVRSQAIPFKLNTNVCQLANGKLFHPGRIAPEPDSFPCYPAGLINDSGRFDGDWRQVLVQGPCRLLPDGEFIGHAESSAIIEGRNVYFFTREDAHNVPLLYVSHDNAESWCGPFAHDIPFTGSKIYAGTLSDGRHYLIGNVFKDRRTLAVFFSEPGKMNFRSGGIIQQDYNAELDLYPQWCYPVAWEDDGKLYVIYTALTTRQYLADGTVKRFPHPDSVPWREQLRAAVLTVIPLK